jgi:hypothetical protein
MEIMEHGFSGHTVYCGWPLFSFFTIHEMGYGQGGGGSFSGGDNDLFPIFMA